MVTALTGAGMTGSYIFSQTIFSMRAGICTRIHGAVIAGAHAANFTVCVTAPSSCGQAYTAFSPVCVPMALVCRWGLPQQQS